MSLKALILAAGKGTRLKPLTDTVPKPLIPVGNRPIIFYVLDQVIQTGIKDIGIVVSPETAAPLQEAIGDGSLWQAKISYIMQNETRGLAHAVKVSRDFLRDSSFLMFLGDNLIEGSIVKFVQEFNERNPSAFVLLKEVPDPRLFGVAELDALGKVTRLVEKPQEPKSNLALVGVYLFTPHILEAVESIKPSGRGEYEITDAIQWLMDRGDEVHSYVFKGWWLDAGKKDDLLEANRVVLDDFITRNIKGKVDDESNVVGRVEIKNGTSIINSTIRGPVSIAENCLIKNSFVGPFTSVGSGTTIEDASIEYSMVMEGCRISQTGRVIDSIMGKRTIIQKTRGGFNELRVFVGNDARLEL